MQAKRFVFNKYLILRKWEERPVAKKIKNPKGKIKCPECNELIDEGLVFCPECGVRIPEFLRFNPDSSHGV